MSKASMTRSAFNPKPAVTRVLYRTQTVGNFKGEVTAILPDVPSKPGPYYTCYAHVGQHGDCHRDWYLNDTRPATAEEYADLHKELSRIYGGTYAGDPDGVTLRIVSRIARNRS